MKILITVLPRELIERIKLMLNDLSIKCNKLYVGQVHYLTFCIAFAKNSKSLEVMPSDNTQQPFTSVWIILATRTRLVSLEGLRYILKYNVIKSGKKDEECLTFNSLHLNCHLWFQTLITVALSWGKKIQVLWFKSFKHKFKALRLCCLVKMLCGRGHFPKLIVADLQLLISD